MNTLGNALTPVSALAFKPSIYYPDRPDLLIPNHCGNPLTFFFPVSFCRACGEEFDTVQIVHAARSAMGQPPISEEKAVLAGVLTGIAKRRI
jgi:hypothetical protein